MLDYGRTYTGNYQRDLWYSPRMAPSRCCFVMVHTMEPPLAYVVMTYFGMYIFNWFFFFTDGTESAHRREANRIRDIYRAKPLVGRLVAATDIASNLPELNSLKEVLSPNSRLMTNFDGIVFQGARKISELWLQVSRSCVHSRLNQFHMQVATYHLLSFDLPTFVVLGEVYIPRYANGACVALRRRADGPVLRAQGSGEDEHHEGIRSPHPFCSKRDNISFMLGL